MKYVFLFSNRTKIKCTLSALITDYKKTRVQNKTITLNVLPLKFFFKFHDIFEVFVVCLWIFFFCSHKQVGIANRNCTNLLFSSDIHSLFCLTVSMVAATISLFFFFFQREILTALRLSVVFSDFNFRTVFLVLFCFQFHFFLFLRGMYLGKDFLYIQLTSNRSFGS